MMCHPGASRSRIGSRIGYTGGMATTFQRGDGIWVADVTISTTPRRRKRYYGATREAAESKLAAAAARGEFDPRLLTPREPVKSRAEWLREARARGRHTPAEWAALVRSGPKDCPYCETPLNSFNDAKDHIVSIDNGGSDTIDNIQRICWECNASKSKRDDYVYEGPRPRPFRPRPKVRAEYERAVSRRGSIT